MLCSEENRTGKGLLVSTPFIKWVKINDALASHSKSTHHTNSMQDADTLRRTVENRKTRVDVMVSSALQERLAANKYILQEIVRVILYLTKQSLPLRGHRKQVSSNANPGNVLALLKVAAESDAMLKQHLEQPIARNATYLSARSQNDIIGVIGYDIIRKNLVTEI